ncbi:MAG: IMP cyclohydrolase [Candidatus Microsaccharimonas sp.]
MSAISPETFAENRARLVENPYAGRGIIQGLSASAMKAIQVYWLMGRSDSSRARVLAVRPDEALGADTEKVQTEPHGLPEGTDTSLIIYNAMRSHGRRHVVTNGDQTDTIIETLQRGGSFKQALATRIYEPDAPNYTPRISGMVDLSSTSAPVGTLSVIKKAGETPFADYRSFAEVLTPDRAGIGQTIHTYMGDGSPLPSFSTPPYELPLGDDIRDIAQEYWEALNEANRVALVTKSIDLRTGDYDYFIINAADEKKAA